ncbi:hypothetical protein K435DRAFT_789028 [Dendrothele bispora CBS 962.96]|uniref:Uncharacterized protein n=1 Tax=Dendrothele bispora (strain CBS 962.96) TaxID=1314807 RepID=A0A4S8MUL7_DENBC|nr:hypothetical protein K435DRAFT_789028 [Dendrothele bispora CBS 962.96]
MNSKISKQFKLDRADAVDAQFLRDDFPKQRKPKLKEKIFTLSAVNGIRISNLLMYTIFVFVPRPKGHLMKSNNSSFLVTTIRGSDGTPPYSSVHLQFTGNVRTVKRARHSEYSLITRHPYFTADCRIEGQSIITSEFDFLETFNRIKVDQDYRAAKDEDFRGHRNLSTA